MMIIVSITFVILIHSLMKTATVGENCDDIRCSNVFDPVCGMTQASESIKIIRKYQNICHFSKTRCKMERDLEIDRIPDEMCNIKKKKTLNSSGRRLTDYSIVGAHEACNHTCPTYCVDTYEPACAQIWKKGMSGFTYRPMINHCHIDLFSCALAVNVTIHSLGRCYKNPAGLLFMSQVAALKSLRLLDDTPLDYRVNKYVGSVVAPHRRNLDGNEP